MIRIYVDIDIGVKNVELVSGTDMDAAVQHAKHIHDCTLLLRTKHLALLRKRNGHDVFVVLTPEHRLVEQDRTHWETV